MSAPKSESVMLCLKYWDSSSPAVARMQQATAKANAAPQTADVCRAIILPWGVRTPERR